MAPSPSAWLEHVFLMSAREQVGQGVVRRGRWAAQSQVTGRVRLHPTLSFSLECAVDALFGSSR